MQELAEVAVHVGSAHAADILYHYRIPPGLTCVPGSRVLVPFGKSNKQVTGFVMSIVPEQPGDTRHLKNIVSCPDDAPVLSTEQMHLVHWLRENTFSTYYEAITTILPSAALKHTRPRKKQVSTSAVPDIPPLILSQEQQEAYDRIAPSLEMDKAACFLLRGVTGSGKTSVFEKLISRTLSLGKSVILLLPEIGLTPQMIQHFEARFPGRTALMHSRLSDGERRLSYERARTGAADFIIGTRSAVFAPLSNIGLIIMDEEGERSYKSDAAPRYDTIEVAKHRVRYHNAVLLAASATPTIESYSRAKRGIYQLVELKHRYQNIPLPEVQIVDMRTERTEGNTSEFSRPLREAIQENLNNHEQTILLLNRRGYHTIISCCICNQPIYCQHCSIPMTWHETDNLLHCHYCGFVQPIPVACPVCRGTKLKKMGFGTQKLEEDLAADFPAARILRMDADTTTRKNAYAEKFEAFRNGEYDIMLGTQMIGKGLDFPNVTLVGVVSVDKALFSGDFRSYERTFSLITQVVGRSGRSSKNGRAILQTFMPDHYVLRLAAEQNFEQFFEEETAIRRMMIFPPFCDICVIGFTAGKQEESGKRCRGIPELS